MKIVDLIIIGAGPAGITAAIYAARKKIDFLIIAQEIGGQAALSADIENYTGYQFITGAELVTKFEEHLKQFSVQLKTDEVVTRITKGVQPFFKIETESSVYETKSVIIASGRRPRWLQVLGEEKYRNRGISYCATCDGPLFSGKKVAVIGGGNSALDAALQMINIAEKVYVVNINPELGGDAIMRYNLEKSPKAEILNNAMTKEISGDKFLKALKFEQNGVMKELNVEGVFVEIGSVPNSEFIDFVAKNNQNEIMVDNLNRTDVAGIFAAGDVTNVPEKQIIVAAGEGAKAVLGASRYLNSVQRIAYRKTKTERSTLNAER